MIFKTFASRFTKVGNSHAVIIPKAVQETLGLVPGDLMVMRMFGKLLICRRLDPRDVVEVDSIPTDAIPSGVRP